jgi:hypothetical protein
MRDNNWSSYGIPGTEHGLFYQLYGLHRGNEMRKEQEIETGVKYEYILRVRPDGYFMDKFPALETLDFGENPYQNVLFSSFSSCCCGNQDTFGIGRADAMDLYLDRVMLLTMPNLQLFMHQWNAEDFTNIILKRFGNIGLIEAPTIHYCLVKPLSRRAPGDGRLLF